MQDAAIKTHKPDKKKYKKRRREAGLAFLAFFLIILFSWIQLKFFGVNSYLFLAVFNLNLILLLVILFVVVRNGVKLFLDRRRNIRGSKLRSRLVMAFFWLSIIPTAAMFLLATKVFQTSVDYWFRSQVDSSMEQAVQVGQTFYNLSQQRLERQGTHIINTIRESKLLWGAEGMDAYLQEKMQEYDLSLIGVIRPDLQEQNWHATEEWEENWKQIKENVDWVGLKDKPQFWYKMITDSEQDFLIGILPVDKAKSGFLVLGCTFNQGLISKMDTILQGVKEYKQLKTLRSPFKIAFYVLLGVITLLIIFGSMWFGFRLAKEITAPIQALSLGTQRIAHGDLAVRLEDKSEDELGLLVQSFNSMAEDLENSQEHLNKANIELANQNLELEQRRQYMEAVLDNITAGVISLDREDKVSTVNQAAENILSVDSQELIGKNINNLLLTDYVEIFKEAFGSEHNAPKGYLQRQLEIKIDDEKRKLLVNTVELKGTQKEKLGMVIVFEDITELDKMQRMAAWRDVARRIAHDIKNPLTPIKLSAQRLERKFGPSTNDPAFVESIGLIVRQVEHLQQMVKEFSSFAKLPEVNLNYNHLPSLLEEVVALFENSHTHIQWDLTIENSLPEFKFDRSALKRVFINLLTNASEALKTENEPMVKVWSGYDAHTGWVRIEVKDNGPGLKTEEQNRLFEPYFSRKDGNSGLGLTIVKSIINDHHGFVQVKPNQPRGSIFIVQLPV